MGFCGISSRVPQIPSLRRPLIPDPYNNDETKKRLLYNNKKKKNKGGGSSLALLALASGGGCSSSSSSVKKVVKLGKKWKEYQGVQNWEGLLDPLDDNLRKEIIRYGKFVEAAYKSFNFDPCSPSYGTCLHSKSSLFHRSGLPSTGYRVCRHLRATSGIRLPRWLPNDAPNSTWIGYVAVCQDKHEISRLGRRDVVIAFRGTATVLEWLENVRATLTKLPPAGDDDDDDGQSYCSPPPMVESGFLSLYTSETESCQSLRQMVREEISRVLKTYAADDDDEEEKPPVSLTITGHSLGAALATLAAYDIKQHFPMAAMNNMMVTVMSFGGPRVGNSTFRKRLEKQGTKVLRIVNSDDVITKLPGFLVKEDQDHHHHHHHHTKAERSGSGRAGYWNIHKCLEDTQWAWAYSEVGRELRLSTRDSPHLTRRIINNVATSHDLNTYLHLVDGFVSSTCPFRSSTPSSRSNINPHP